VDRRTDRLWNVYRLFGLRGAGGRTSAHVTEPVAADEVNRIERAANDPGCESPGGAADLLSRSALAAALPTAERLFEAPTRSLGSFWAGDRSQIFLVILLATRISNYRCQPTAHAFPISLSLCALLLRDSSVALGQPSARVSATWLQQSARSQRRRSLGWLSTAEPSRSLCARIAALQRALRLRSQAVQSCGAGECCGTWPKPSACWALLDNHKRLMIDRNQAAVVAPQAASLGGVAVAGNFGLGAVQQR